MRPYGVFVSEVDYVKQKYCFEFVYLYMINEFMINLFILFIY